MKKVAKKKKAVKKEVKKTPGVAVITINVKENDALSGAEGKVIAKIEGSVNFHMMVKRELEARGVKVGRTISISSPPV